MGQKAHPISLRMGLTKGWATNWFPKNSHREDILIDQTVRDIILLGTKHGNSEANKEKDTPACKDSLSELKIERQDKKLRITVVTAKPGIVIGKKGAGIEAIKVEISKQLKLKLPATHYRPADIFVDIQENKKPDLSAAIVAEGIAVRLAKRGSYRREMKMTMQRVMKSDGVLGIKVMISGRLNGADIASSQAAVEGSIPCGTFDADVDYHEARSETTYGTLGVKVWIYKASAKQR